jgi:hypothetical protein
LIDITRTSILTGIKRTLPINCTQEQLDDYASGKDLIQNIFPQLSADDREFILSGIVATEWEAEFAEDADE